MKIMVLGGDGFCGWPTSLKLAKEGHDVVIVDNLSRRRIDKELNSKSLTNIASTKQRVKTANRHFDLLGNIDFVEYNIAYQMMCPLINEHQPDVIVHFGEQRSAPYSMKGAEGRQYTVDNNIRATHNVLSGIVESGRDIHLVHLGTMGVYGYNDKFGEIPEGYLNVKIPSTGMDASILYPTDPGSVYHMTKSMDQLMFQFYNKNWGVQITDLHQGIVWGTQTEETKLAPELVNRFDYDGIYGTVLNRFIVQAAINHPLTVYGIGGQKRAFIHIEDTAKCVSLAINTPSKNKKKVRIFNQVSEVRSVMELASIINEKYKVDIHLHDNPRKELNQNELKVSNEGLKSLGFEPITLNDGLIEDVKFIADEVKCNVDIRNLLNSPKW
jgi:UDP-sulfoquinovose synthase